MNLNRSDLIRFLDVIAVGGDLMNREVLLNTNKKGLEVYTITSDKVFSVHGVLDFKNDIEETMGLDRLNLLSNFLNSFSGENVSISKKENKLEIISDDKKMKAKFILSNPKYIQNNLDSVKFNEIKEKFAGNEFVLTPDNVTKFIKTCKTIGKPDLILTQKDDTLILNLENNEDELEVSFDDVKCTNPFSVKISSKIVDILETIKDITYLSIKDEQPGILVHNDVSSNCYVEYLLATMKK